MRNTLPLLSRPPQAGSSQANHSVFTNEATPTHQLPSIRFIAATPSEPNTSIAAVAPFASSPLAPRRQDGEPARKRLVPKKSKLGLLAAKAKEKVHKDKDFSDVVRRVGAETPSTGRSGFEIYVDHDEDSDIVVVKKKKSRLGIDGMNWGALGEVTNVPSVPKEKKSSENLLKVKRDDSLKWWSIGRGRKDVKEKEKNAEEQPQASLKTPETLTPSNETRARFNSLDAGAMLSSESKPRPTRKSSMATLLGLPERSQTPSAESGLLAPATTETNTGSIALRAMRSVRSLARMKSWANVGTGHNYDKEGNNHASNAMNTTTTVTTSKAKVTSDEKKKTKKKKTSKEKENVEKEKEKKKDRKAVLSSSSFEAGALSSQTSLALPPQVEETAMKRKQSKLGLGLPTSMRLGTVRHFSNASSTNSMHQLHQQPSIIGTCLSADSAHLVMGPHGQPAPTVSSGSSLRPPSSVSGFSAVSLRSPRSSTSSAISVRWDEAGLRTVREMQRRERQSRRLSTDAQTRVSYDSKESKRTSEGRRRAAIADIFPEIQEQSPSMHSTIELAEPVLNVQEATIDGHENVVESPESAPMQKVRRRPMSEQLLGKARPKPITEDGEGVMSVLDAATKDLASLINRLDLEATPASKKDSPLKRSPISLRRSPSSASLGIPGEGSPCKTKFTFNKDIDAPLLPTIGYPTALKPRASLRPKKSLITVAPATKTDGKDSAEHRKLVGKPIVPWSSLDWEVSPKKPTAKPSSTFRPSHKRTITPLPALDSPIAFEPLGPSVKKRVSEIEARASGTPLNIYSSARPSSNTFGSGTIHKIGKQPSFEDDDDETPPPSPSPAVKKTRRHSRKASVLSAMCDSGVILPPEAMKSLGLMGTMGGKEPEVDPDDPDSDIPDELQSILSGQSDEEPVRDTQSYKRYSSPPPEPPPMAAIPRPQFVPANEEPIFRATIIDDEDHETDIDELTPNEDDTGNSFDFTGELRKLNVSGGSDRRSFVEQLENAFRTPVRVELGFSLAPDIFVKDTTTPASAAPLGYKDTPGEDLVPRSVTDADLSSLYESQDESQSFRDSSATDTLDHLIAECEADICRYFPTRTPEEHSVRSQESDGKLNTSFKFGGQPSTSDVSAESSLLSKPLTLSDIIPPLSHQPGVSDLSSEEDSSVLKSILGQLYDDDSSVVRSIMAEATETFIPPRPQARPRLDSTASSKRLSQDLANLSKMSGHSRNPSELSFAGLESYEEIRRAFEFGPNRPSFYPPPGAASRTYNKQRDSFYSIASMSSYGAVLDSGKPDPFGYASSRPVSEDVSMSMTMSSTVDDTFSFMKKGRRRSRVDSDTSSFYFRGLGSSHPHRHSHLRNESNFSMVSKAPLNNLHYRGLGARLRNDSNASMSSQAQSFLSGISGLQGNRPTWARHRQEPSSDSAMSKFSAARLGRPGLGERMFERDYSMPLSTSSGSPDESPFSDRYNECSPYDSIFDGENNDSRPRSAESIYEETGRAVSSSEDIDNIFDLNLDHSDPQEEAYVRLRQFRPISMISTTSTHSAPGEDDTMISMLGGGHVRRRSVDSGVDGSPCINLERKKNTALQHLARVLQFDDRPDELPPAMPERQLKVSPDKVLLQKPSIASTTSQYLGGELIIASGKGLLERPNPDDNILIAQGEELLQSLQSNTVLSNASPVGRSRSSTCSSSSGIDTPPLSNSDNSSVSSGSQCSIDLVQLNAVLANMNHPSSNIGTARTVRARARGTGHRRRISQVRVSRASIYETIEEEPIILSYSPASARTDSPPSTTGDSQPEVKQDSVFIVDADSASYQEHWNDETGIMTIRRYHALCDEAEEIVTESKRVWEDTPFSVFALQSFQPPKDITGMQAMLEQSKQEYGPLPSELRPRRVRSRTSSRPSPYPIRRPFSRSPEKRPIEISCPSSQEPSVVSSALRQISINPNVNIFSQPSTVDKPLSYEVETETSKPAKATFANPRPRVSSSARRTALGWSKRSTGKSSKSSNANKENCNKENASQGSMTHPDNLRVSRPRPRGRLSQGRKAISMA